MSNDRSKPANIPNPKAAAQLAPKPGDAVRHEPGSLTPASKTPAAVPPGTGDKPNEGPATAEHEVAFDMTQPAHVAAAEGADRDARQARAREAGLAEPPSSSQVQKDEPRPNYETIQAPPGQMAAVVGREHDPLADAPPGLVDALTARILAQLQGNPGVMNVPAGFKLVPAEPTASEKSLSEQAYFKEQAGKTTTERSQEQAEKLFTPIPTDKFFRIRLADGNMHPVLYIPGADQYSAIARYNLLCGIQSTDKKHTVQEVARRTVFEYRDVDADEAERRVKPKKGDENK